MQKPPGADISQREGRLFQIPVYKLAGRCGQILHLRSVAPLEDNPAYIIAGLRIQNKQNSNAHRQLSHSKYIGKLPRADLWIDMQQRFKTTDFADDRNDKIQLRAERPHI